jgi:hypothetical protein
MAYQILIFFFPIFHVAQVLIIKTDDLTRFGYKQKPESKKIYGTFDFFGYVILKSNVKSWRFRVFKESKFDN